MPAPTNPYDRRHLRDISSYLKKIDDIFREAAGEAAAIAASVKDRYDPGKPFSFDDYPKTRKRVDSLLKGLQRGIETVVTDGVTEQWGLSNAKNDEAARKALGKAADDLTEGQRERYFSDHAAALDAFRKRKADGLGLSDKVWKYTDQFREEIEMGIDTGLSEGRSADRMSRDLRGYLRNPDKLFRRVRDARGSLVLSRNAKAYHPGAGVYRSSYRNARRLAATETNMAYRTADNERWKDMDFVVGIEIQTSNNHTLNGKPLEDICDTLAGRYPKDFKFTGWHPQCRCFATAILKTEEEMRADNGRILAGEEPLPAEESVNHEGSLPRNFTDWLDANRERMEDAKSLPYFISDNEGLINGAGEGAGTPETLRRLDEAIAAYQYTDRRLKAREEEINAKMRELFDNNDFGLEIRHGYISDVIDNGFKNTFEIGRDHPWENPGSNFGEIDDRSNRLVISHRMFGITGTDGLSSPADSEQRYTGEQLQRSGYEKYGHLVDNDKTLGYTENGASGYGDVQVRFKKDMVRCTWTFVDSFKYKGEYCQPSLTTDPRVESFDRFLERSADKLLDNSDWNSLTEWQRQNNTKYVELQYHGRLTIDCVQSMTFPSDPKALIGGETTDRLLAKGIELWYMKDGKAVRYKP